MKKLLLFAGMLFYCLGVFAQQGIQSTVKLPVIKSNSIAVRQPHRAIKKIINTADETMKMNNEGYKILPLPVTTRKFETSDRPQGSGTEMVIGTTTYDLQTNGTISNRIVNNGDGTLSAVWTMSQDPGGITGNFPDRGTGYNYYDAVGNWGALPTTRIEPFRTGFTNIAYAPGGHEAILCHDFTSTNGEVFSSRPVKGIGTWTTNSIPNTSNTDVWPKLTAGGANGQTLHALWQGTATNAGPLYYSRSTDNGFTWSAKAEIPSYVMGVDYPGLGGDSYSIDARGNTVAIVAGDLGGQDLVLLKSTDNGTTWTKTIVYQFPIPNYDGATMNTDTNSDNVADTLFTHASDETVVIDNFGMAHVFFGGTRCLEAAGATALGYFMTPGLYYWNETMAPNTRRLIATAPDLNNDGVLSLPTGCGNDTSENPVGYYGTGIVAFICMPSAGVDANNFIYLSYQAVDELSDTTIYFEDFVHPYLIRSCDGGLTWTNPDSALDIMLYTIGNQSESLDGVYCSMAKLVDNNIHLLYQRDFAPGTTLSGTNFPCESGNNNGSSNDIVYSRININTFPFCQVGIQNPSGTNSAFNISANYPNPFNGKTSFDINLKKPADVSVEVCDLFGRILSINKYVSLSSGVHQLTIDASKFAAGVYTYKVKAGNDSATKKMIVQ